MDAAALRRSETRLAWIALALTGVINSAAWATGVAAIVLAFFCWSLYLTAKAE